MSLTTGGVLASIVPFDPTVGVTVVATVALVAIVLGIVFLAVAPLVSDSWADELSATTSNSSPSVAGADDD